MQIEKAYLFARQISAGVPPTPILPPSWWINDYHVDHFHDLKTPTSASSRPCIFDSFARSFEIVTSISVLPLGQSDCGVTGANEISIFREENVLQVPFYDSNEQLTEYSLKFKYGEHSQSTQENWRPQVSIGFYNGETTVWTPVSKNYTFTTSEVKKVFVYAGVDTTSLWRDSPYNTMGSLHGTLFCGIAVIREVDGASIVKHLGGGYFIQYLNSASQGHMSSAWYTEQ